MAKMDDSPYSSFTQEQLILRDHLAADRTVLANERTFLAYARTALTLVVGGITLIRFFDHELTSILGWVLVPLGLLTMVVGIRGYYRMRRRITAINRALPASPETDVGNTR